MHDPLSTHEVLNQPDPLYDYDLFETDAALGEALAREGAGAHLESVRAIGRLAGTAAVIRAGFLANENRPVLHTHDRCGNRIDEVEFHPAWHEMMGLSVKHGLHASPWSEPGPGAHVARAARYYLLTQMEQGHACPITMTHAVVPALEAQPDVAKPWLPLIYSRQYDPRVRPAGEKTGVIFGMAMTEKQGGSDVRSNTTKAVPAARTGPGELYELTGHKWFVSAPMADAFLMLAQAPGGLTCFLVPRWREDGTKNGFRIERLKDKVGNRSNASSEWELSRCQGRMVGEEGKGVRTIIEMVNHTRFDCAMGSTGLMRQAFVQAAHHVSQRRAFGRRLVDQPAMQNVLADIALEIEAGTALFMRLARALDRRDDRDFEGPFGRIGTPVSKYYICKRTPMVVYEAMECLGGLGYIEESALPRLFREAPVNSIWEGSGTVTALDVLRAMDKEPATVGAILTELRAARGGDRRLDDLIARVEKSVGDEPPDELTARRFVERIAIGLQASLLVRHAPGLVADAFCATRIGGDWGRCLGTLPRSVDAAALIARAWAPAQPEGRR